MPRADRRGQCFFGGRVHLNSEQLEAVQHREGHLLIAAGAGTGKTHTLACRAASLISDGLLPYQIVLVTFTNAAAHEIKFRVRGLVDRGELITAGTFHSLAYRLLVRHGYLIGLGNFSVLDRSESDSLLGFLRKELQISLPKEVKTRKIAELISYEANTDQALADLCQEHWVLQDHVGAILALQEAYFSYKRENGLLDYDDLLWSLLELLESHPEAVREYRHVMTDEFQDTSPVQVSLLRAFAAAGAQLTAVGDPCQAIYAFRGAVPSVMNDFAQEFSCTQVVLYRNYRSGQEVLDYANQVIRSCPGLIRHDLCSKGLPGSVPQILDFQTDTDEAFHLASTVRLLLADGVAPEQIAVLYSASQHSLALQMELTKLKVPFLTRGGLRLHDTAHVKDMLALLRLSVDQQCRISRRRVFMLIPGIGEKIAARIGETLSPESVPAKARPRFQALIKTLAAMQQASTADIWQAAFTWYKPLLTKPHQQYELEEVGKACAASFSVQRFLDDMALDSVDPEEHKGKVCLSTVHSAKGREWDRVFVIGLADGRFTSALPSTQEYYEAVRLFYVAVTRCRKHLCVTVPLLCRGYDRHYRHCGPSLLLLESTP